MNQYKSSFHIFKSTGTINNQNGYNCSECQQNKLRFQLNHYNISFQCIFHCIHILILLTQLPTNRHYTNSTNLYPLRGNSYVWHNQKTTQKTLQFHQRVPKFVLWTQCSHELRHPHSSGRIDQAKHKNKTFISTHVAFIHQHKGILGISIAHAGCCPIANWEPVLVMTVGKQVNGGLTQNIGISMVPLEIPTFSKWTCCNIGCVATSITTCAWQPNASPNCQYTHAESQITLPTPHQKKETTS